MHIMYKTIRLLSALVFPPIFWSMYTWPRLKLLEISITSLMRWTCIGLLEVKPKSAPCRRRFLQGAIYLLVWFAWLWSWLIFFFFSELSEMFCVHEQGGTSSSYDMHVDVPTVVCDLLYEDRSFCMITFSFLIWHNNSSQILLLTLEKRCIITAPGAYRLASLLLKQLLKRLLFRAHEKVLILLLDSCIPELYLGLTLWQLDRLFWRSG